MAEKKRRAPTPSSYTVSEEADAPQQVRKMSIPLPDYDTLFPQKRHGVQGQTRWDHIIAEVNQKHRDFSEMSVDGPEEDYEPSVGSLVPTESPTASHYQTHQPQPLLPKKTAAPAPPKPDPKPVADSQSQYTAYKSPLKPVPAVPEPVKESLGSWRTPAALLPPRTTSLVDTPAEDDQRASLDKEMPTAKPRQRAAGKEPVKQEDPVDKHMKSDFYNYTRSSIKTDMKSRKESIEFDPFPSTNLLSSDPWAAEEDDFFTIGVKKEQKLEDQGMTPDDLDKIFSQEKQTDPFAEFNGRENTKKEEHSPTFQRKNSPRQKLSFPSTKSQQEPEEKSQVSSVRSARNGTVAPKAETKPQSGFYGEDQFGAEPFAPAGTLSEPLQVVLEEAEPMSPPGGLSGGKGPLRAWVSPSDIQPVSAQNSNGGGLAFTPRRPHPVKPMSSESPFGPPAVKEIKVRDRAAGKTQVSDPVESGPFTQLTQEELITLVVRQQADLSRKDTKIVELEEYIDNLLVRVIDEQPGILHSLNATKPV